MRARPLPEAAEMQTQAASLAFLFFRLLETFHFFLRFCKHIFHKFWAFLSFHNILTIKLNVPTGMQCNLLHCAYAVRPSPSAQNFSCQCIFFIFFFAPFSFLLSTAMQITGPRAGLSSGSFWGIRFDFRTHVTQQERA